MPSDARIPDAAGPVLKTWSGEFRDAAQEEAFITDQWPRLARQLRLASTIGAIGYFSAYYIDFLSFGFSTPGVLLGLGRLLVALLLLGLIRSTFRTARYTVASRVWLMAAEIALGAVEATQYHYFQWLNGVAHGVNLPFVLFLIMAAYVAFPNRLALTTVASAVMGSFWSFFLWLGPSTAPGTLYTYTLSLLAAIGFGIALVRSSNRMTRTEYSQRLRLQHEIAERRKAQERAEQANRVKGRFLAMMNHEMRTPLNGVLGGVQLLQDSSLSGEQYQYAGIIERSGQQLAALIDEVLDLARIEAGHLDLAREKFDLTELMTDVDTILRPQMAERGLTLTLEIDKDIRGRLQGDPVRLRQVLLNLGGNALKFTPQGTVTIRVERLESDTAGVRLRFSVSDSGIGLSEAEQRAVFQPFVQADDSIGRHYGGSGLGLAISRELVEAMGGSLRVESEKGRGSRFFFELELPLAVRGADEQEHTVAVDAPLKPCRLLLVEDMEANRVIAAALLERMGHTTVAARDGAEGLALAAQEAFDAILMDMHMPGMDGLETTRRIRALDDPKRAAVPIIALSADAQRSTVESCLGAGMQAFVPKPLRKERLARTLAQVIAGAESVVDEAPAAASMETATGLIDSAYLAGIRADLGEPIYRQTLATAVRSLRTLAADMECAIAEQDWRRLKDLGHQLKGLAGNYGLSALFQRAQRLHAAAGGGDGGQLARMHAEVAALVEETIRRLDEPLV